MSKVIFTADDYGVIPSIDEGIIKSVKARKINSVAAFSNHSSAVDRVKRLIDEGGNPDLEVGCHLTITSGSPLINAGLKNMQRRNGLFRSFTQMKRPARKYRVQEIVELEKELTAQLEVLLDGGIEVKHLSSHHNALYFFEDYADTLFAVANKFDLPVRSPINEPSKQQNRYVFQLVLRLFDNMNLRDRSHIRKFMRDASGYLSRRQDSKPIMPDQYNSAHYGPAPLPLFDLDLDDIREEVIGKKCDMDAEFSKWVDKDGTVEFVFHIINDNYDELEDYMKQTKDYCGINSDYFDARIAEFQSLQSLILPNGLSFGSWSTLS